MNGHIHGSPNRVTRLVVEGHTVRALTCGICGAYYGLTPWPVTVRKDANVSPTSKPSDPAAAAAARAVLDGSLYPVEKAS